VRPLSAGIPGAESIIQGAAFPNYSTDGQRLYFRGSTTSTIMVGDRDGGNSRIAFTGSQPVGEFDLPANEGLLAGIFQDAFNGACVPFEARLVQVAPSATLKSTTDTNVDSITISPDGRWIAYTNRLYCNVIGTTLFDTNRLCLIDTAAGGFSETCQIPANVQGSDFSSTGTMIVFSANFSGQNEIWRASITPSGGLANYTQLTRGPTGQRSLRPRVSSDGNWVIFVRDIDAGPGELMQAHIVRADGDSLRSLGFPARTIVWSGGGPGGPVVGLSQRAYLPLTIR
jgi:WD40-like Beta Propeller Repeat